MDAVGIRVVGKNLVLLAGAAGRPFLVPGRLVNITLIAVHGIPAAGKRLALRVGKLARGIGVRDSVDFSRNPKQTMLCTPLQAFLSAWLYTVTVLDFPVGCNSQWICGASMLLRVCTLVPLPQLPLEAYRLGPVHTGTRSSLCSCTGCLEQTLQPIVCAVI